jgi:hypothetical protein
VSRQAVTYHVGNLLAKFQCSSRTGLVSRAFVLGVLLPSWPPMIARQAAQPGLGTRSKPCRHGVKDLYPRRTFH